MSAPTWLVAMRARGARATKGPWVAKPFDESQMTIHPSARDGRQPLIATMSIGYKRPDGEANADFVAHARADLPALLSLVEALAGMLETATVEEDPDVWQADALALLARYATGPEA